MSAAPRTRRGRAAGAAALRHGVCGLVLALGAAGCTASPSTPSIPASPSPPASPSASAAAPAPSPSGSSEPAVPTALECAARVVADMSRAERAGQVVMVGVTNGSAAERQVLTRHSIGSVILMGNHTDGVDGVRRVTSRLSRNGQATPILVATDQEGGTVQRLKGPGFSTIPSARSQATWSNARLSRQAASWGAQLKKAGVHWTLAPVADVVPAKLAAGNAPIGALGRGYGSTPASVAAKVKAFSAGMHAAGVATSVKHFPGIGRVRGNTDFSTGVIDRVSTADDPGLLAFKAGLQRPRSSVMMSTVTYTAIDPDNPAAFSARTIDLVRSRLGFDGVVISDDLGAAAAVASVPARQRGVRFIKAGGSLAMTVDASLADEFVEGLRAAQQKDPKLAEALTRAATAVVALKVELGLVPCG